MTSSKFRFERMGSKPCSFPKRRSPFPSRNLLSDVRLGGPGICVKGILRREVDVRYSRSFAAARENGGYQAQGWPRVPAERLPCSLGRFSPPLKFPEGRAEHI